MLTSDSTIFVQEMELQEIRRIAATSQALDDLLDAARILAAGHSRDKRYQVEWEKIDSTLKALLDQEANKEGE